MRLVLRLNEPVYDSKGVILTGISGMTGVSIDSDMV